MAEVGVEQHLDLAVACGQDLGVQALEQFDVARLLVEHEVRFVDLDPFGAQLGELGHDLGVDGGDRVDQALVVFEFFGLRIAGELEEGVRPMSTGLVVMPSAFTSLNSSNGLVLLSLMSVASSTSGTR